MLAADRALSSYQRRMNALEMPAWEHSVERRRSVLNRSAMAPAAPKATKPNVDLIDLDLIRGSAFAKVKPQQRVWSVVRQGMLKAVLFPVYRCWWRRHLDSSLYRLLCLLYLVYVTCLAVYALTSNRSQKLQNISFCELVTPAVIALVLSVLKCQIAAFRETYPIPRQRAANWDTNRAVTSDTSAGVTTGAAGARAGSGAKSGNSSVNDANRGSGVECSAASSSQPESSEVASDVTSDSIGHEVTDLYCNGLPQDTSHGAAAARTTTTTTAAATTQLTSGGWYVKQRVRARSLSDCCTNGDSSGGNGCIGGGGGGDGGGRHPSSGSASNGSQCDVTAAVCAPSAGGVGAMASTDNQQQHPIANTDDVTATTTTTVAAAGASLSGLRHRCRHGSCSPHSDITFRRTTPSRTGSFCSTSRHRRRFTSRHRSTSHHHRSTSRHHRRSTSRHHRSTSRHRSPPSAHLSSSLFNSNSTAPIRSRVCASRGRRTLERQRSWLSTNVIRRDARDTDSPRHSHPHRHLPHSHQPLPHLTLTCQTDSSETFKSDETSASNQRPAFKQLTKRQLTASETANTRRYVAAVKAPSQQSESDLGNCYAKTSGSDSEASCESEVGSVTSGRPEVTSASHWDNPLHTPSDVTNLTGCTMWQRCDATKVYLSALDVCAVVVNRASMQDESTGYFVFGSLMAVSVSLLPAVYRLLLCSALPSPPTLSHCSLSLDSLLATARQLATWLLIVLQMALGSTVTERLLTLSCLFSCLLLSTLLFFLLSVVERSFKQRLLLAKYFCYLTSARRARKFNLVHFRLKNVRNIKTWLSIRSCLKKKGAQRSVNMIASVACLFTVLLVTCLCVELLDTSEPAQPQIDSYRTHLMLWCFALAVFVVRIMTLGSHVNNKYRSLSVVLTEQINLHVQMEQKPHKKEALALANGVLKLAADLLKELERPYTILGFSANPFLYNVTKLLVLSACSGALSDMFGFKLKLNKLKLM